MKISSPNNLDRQGPFLQSLQSIVEYAHQEASLSLTTKFTTPSVPQYSHLYNGNVGNTFLVDFFKLKETQHIKHPGHGLVDWSNELNLIAFNIVLKSSAFLKKQRNTECPLPPILLSINKYAHQKHLFH